MYWAKEIQQGASDIVSKSLVGLTRNACAIWVLSLNPSVRENLVSVQKALFIGHFGVGIAKSLLAVLGGPAADY
jgi:hypothetical protein